jgi:glucose/arabinose dehydrogenase
MTRFRIAIVGVCAVAALCAASARAATVTVAMSGLDSPRGLAWGPEGALYVAEAGPP